MGNLEILLNGKGCTLRPMNYPPRQSTETSNAGSESIFRSFGSIVVRASIFNELGRATEAEALLTKALEVFSTPSERTMTTRAAQLRFWPRPTVRKAGERRRKLFAKALEGYRRNFGDNHIDPLVM